MNSNRSISTEISRAITNDPWPCFRGNAQHTGLSPYNTSINNGELQWKIQFSKDLHSSPAIASDGTIYVGSSNNNFYAINPNGTIKWSIDGGKYFYSSPAISSNGTIFVGCYDNYLYSISPEGQVNWKFRCQDVVCSSPIIGNDGTIYFGSWDGRIYALFPNGEEKWQILIDEDYRIWSSPSIDKNGNIYIGSYDNYLYSITPDGKINWKFKTSKEIYPSPTIGPDGTIYIGSGDKYLYAINPNGTLKWKFMVGGVFGVKSSAGIDSNGIIYIGSLDNSIYAIYPDGSLKWSFNTSDRIYSSPSISNDGIIYIGSGDNYLYSLNSEGELIWKIKSTGNVECSPAIGSNGCIYFGSSSHDDSYLYAIGKILPSQPRNLIADSGDKFVNLSWEKPSNIGGPPFTEYLVYRKIGNDKASLFRTLNNSITNFNDTKVVNGKTYYYYIITKSSFGTSGPSNEVSAFPIGLPAPPLNLTIRSGDKYIELKWEPPLDDGGSPIIFYHIYRNKDYKKFELYLSVNGSINTYNDSKLINGIEYYYYIIAISLVGKSNPSILVNSTPLGKPSPPQNFTLISNNRYIELFWDDPKDNGGSNIIEFDIYRGNDPNETYYYKSIPENTQFFNDTNLINGVEYYYYLIVKNRIGFSDSSDVLFGIPKTYPSPPQDFENISGDKYVLLKWKKPIEDGGSEILEFRVYRDSNHLDTVGSNITGYNDSNVLNGQSYSYQITAINDVGESNLSNKVNGFPSEPIMNNNSKNNNRTESDKNTTQFDLNLIMVVTIIIIIFIIIVLILITKKTKKRKMDDEYSSHQPQTTQPSPIQPMSNQPSTIQTPVQPLTTQYSHKQEIQPQEFSGSYPCSSCTQPLTYIQQNHKWYCYNCKKYL